MICLGLSLNWTMPSRADSESDAVGAGAGAGARLYDVLFVLDNSGSMRQNDPRRLTARAVEGFIAQVEQNPEIDARVGLVLFDERAELVSPLADSRSMASSGRSGLDRALARLRFSGQRTNTAAGVERALYELRDQGREGARRAIVLLTDGRIDTGEPGQDRERARWLREDLARESRAEGIQIFGIAFTESADFELLQALALTTRARYFRVPDAQQLTPVVSEILAQLEHAPDETRAAQRPPAPPRSPLPLGNERTSSGASFPLESSASTQRDAIAGAGDRNALPRWLAFVVPGALLLLGGLWLRRRRQGRPLPAALAAVDPSFHAPLFENMQTGPPTAQLRDLAGRVTDAGATLSLRPGRTTVGRDAHNDIVLDDDAISSEHALIERIEGRFWLEDRRSTNGTCLDGQQIEAGQRVELKGGDAIRFADIDFRFILPGYTPGGDTVVLHAATAATRHEPQETPARTKSEMSMPPRVAVASDDPQAADVAEAAEDPSEESRTASTVVDLDATLATEFAGPDPTADAPAAPETPPSPTETESAQRRRAQLRECLDLHFSQVAELSPALSAFVRRAFEPELREAICQSAFELLDRAKETNALAERAYTQDRIRFLVCAVPGEMALASTVFGEAAGGFTSFLSAAAKHPSFEKDRCEILAVLTFGEHGQSRAGTLTPAWPWVSLSIVPQRSVAPRIDLLSYEFLTEEERVRIEPQIDPEISQSGFA